MGSGRHLHPRRVTSSFPPTKIFTPPHPQQHITRNVAPRKTGCALHITRILDSHAPRLIYPHLIFSLLQAPLPLSLLNTFTSICTISHTQPSFPHSLFATASTTYTLSCSLNIEASTRFACSDNKYSYSVLEASIRLIFELGLVNKHKFIWEVCDFSLQEEKTCPWKGRLKHGRRCSGTVRT